MARKALVLSGGSIKGAFQAGAVAHVLEHGFAPDAIYGTSVGSLNGGFVADRVGRSDPPINWGNIGRELEEFWRQRITEFHRVGRSRGIVSLLFSLKAGRFDGFLDMSRLHDLVHDVISAKNIQRATVDFYACAVDLATGMAVYADRNYDSILDYIIASTSIPLLMPITAIGSELLWDGGIREVAPLRRAIKSGADEIVCIACDAKDLGGAAIPGRKAPFLLLAGRLMEMVTNETLNNDIGTCNDTNTYIRECANPTGLLKSRTAVKLTVIRPHNQLNIDLERFTPEDIANMLQLGRTVAAGVWP